MTTPVPVVVALRSRRAAAVAPSQKSSLAMSAHSVQLRPFQETDLELLDRFATGPRFSTPYEWSGFASPEGFRRRFEDDGFLGKDPHYLAAAEPDETALGWVMWRDPNVFGRVGLVSEIGALLAPEHRGRGAGTAAQCSLEKCGFRREGLLREAGFRGGRWRDVIVYGRL